MLDQTFFIQALSELKFPTKLSVLFEVLQSFLCLSHSSGVRPLSRYSGCSERTIFRMISVELPWSRINLKLFERFIWKENSGDLYALVGDEVVEQKAGNCTHGLRKFYSSTAKKAVNGVNFFGFSLVNLRTGKSAPVDLKQVIYTPADEARLATEKANKQAKLDRTKKGKQGRPKDSLNKPKLDPAQTKPVFRAFKAALTTIIKQMDTLQMRSCLSYILLDSAYIADHYVQLLQEHDLKIIAKLPTNVALYLPYQGEKGKTKPRKYGDKVQFNTLPESAYLKTTTEDEVRYDYFQYQALRKGNAKRLLNILTIRATSPNGKITYAHLFTNDLTLSPTLLEQYYSLRFKIEFDFRDVKQLLGLTKIKNYRPIQLNNMFRMTYLLGTLVCQNLPATMGQQTQLTQLEPY